LDTNEQVELRNLTFSINSKQMARFQHTTLTGLEHDDSSQNHKQTTQQKSWMI